MTKPAWIPSGRKGKIFLRCQGREKNEGKRERRPRFRKKGSWSAAEKLEGEKNVAMKGGKNQERTKWSTKGH